MLKGIAGVLPRREACKSEPYFVDDLDFDIEECDFDCYDFDYYVSQKCGYHVCRWSALYNSGTYVDEVQDEDELDPCELYVVCYWHCVPSEQSSYWSFSPAGTLVQNVDFAVTKDEIIKNVRNQKYVEGAMYYTMGSMFWTTKMVLEGKWPQARLVE